MTTDPEALIASAQTRGDCKRLGALLDQDQALKNAVVTVARKRGVDLPDDAHQWPGKRLLRRARGREDAARERTNPIARDESFVCVRCGAAIPPHGRSARDHCPYCLVGLHVDAVTPGDRASSCGGELEPVRACQENGRWLIVYRCLGCGAERRNQVLMDGDPPDDWKRVVQLSSTGA